ncbi:hypothetical protein ACFLQ2_02955 [archaeon]
MNQTLSTVLLLALIAIVGMAFFFWAAEGLSSKGISVPIVPITANLLSNDYLSLQVLVANMGERTIPAGTVFVLAENGAIVTLDNDLLPDQQALIMFGGVESNNPIFFPAGSYTIYGTKTGSSVISAVPVSTLVVLGSVPLALDPSSMPANPVLTEGSDGELFVFWESDGNNKRHVFVSDASRGGGWSPETRVSDSQENTNPAAAFGDGESCVAWTITNPSGVEHVFVKQSTDGEVWGEKYQAENEANNNRQPSIIVDDAGIHWIAWSSGIDGDYDLRIKNSTECTTFDPEPARVVTENDALDSFPSLIQDASGTYWIAFYSNQSGSDGIWITYSIDGIDWSEPWQLSTRPNAKTPSLIYDSNGVYQLAYDAEDGEYSHIWIMCSTDGILWLESQRISELEVVERKPALTQTSNAVYWIAFEALENGTTQIYVRGTTDATVWDL